MTFVERFIEIDGWPVSRKTALLAGLGVVIHSVNWAVGHGGAVNAGIVNLVMFDALMAVWWFLLIVVLGLSMITARLGKEGHWIAYLIVVLFGGWMATFIYASGIWNSPTFAMFPLLVITVTLFYGIPQIGWFAFGYGLFSIGVIWGAQRSGALPYAPMLLDASDTERVASWGRITAVGVIGFYIFCFVLSVLVVTARKIQDLRLQEAQRLIRRYVPSQVADAILSGREEMADKYERRKLTVFFSDLVGFTNISEELEPEDLSRVLNEYFSEMTAIAHKHGGTVDELSGDAILIFFGAPHATDDKDHALRAVRMAVEMQQAVSGLNAKWRSVGIDVALQVRMGINTGVVTVGNFGSPERMKYAALGKHVNLAARIQAQCEPGRILISHATWLLVNDQIPCMPKGEMQLKGINKPVITYEVTGS